MLRTFFVFVGRSRYAEEVGELERTCDDLTTERNAMLVKLEGLKRRKRVETEVREEQRHGGRNNQWVGVQNSEGVIAGTTAVGGVKQRVGCLLKSRLHPRSKVS